MFCITHRIPDYSEEPTECTKCEKHLKECTCEEPGIEVSANDEDELPF